MRCWRLADHLPEGIGDLDAVGAGIRFEEERDLEDGGRRPGDRLPVLEPLVLERGCAAG